MTIVTLVLSIGIDYTHAWLLPFDFHFHFTIRFPPTMNKPCNYGHRLHTCMIAAFWLYISFYNVHPMHLQWISPEWDYVNTICTSKCSTCFLMKKEGQREVCIAAWSWCLQYHSSLCKTEPMQQQCMFRMYMNTLYNAHFNLHLMWC